MCFYHDGARASGEIIWQSKNNLRERHVRYWSHVFRGYVVTLIITVDQIDDDRGRGLVWEQLEISNEQSYTRISETIFTCLKKVGLRWSTTSAKQRRFFSTIWRGGFERRKVARDNGLTAALWIPHPRSGGHRREGRTKTSMRRTT